MEELELFVQEIDNLCCIIDEGASVRELLVLGKQFVERSESQLQLSLESLEESELETLINEGSSLRIELQQLDLLQKRLKQCKWYKRSQGLRETSSKLTYQDVKNLLHIAAADLDPTDPYVDKEMRKLQQIGADIEAWESQAAKYFRRLTQQHELGEIEQFLKSASDINGQVPSHGLLKDALRKAREWLRAVEQLQQNNHVTYCHTLEAMIERGLNIPLSAVTCECNDKLIVCLRHYTVLCGCAPEKHTLIYRYTLDEMPLMLQKLKVKAHSFERWLSRCRDIVDAHTPTSVTLQELQELCKEAETKKFPSSLLIDRLNAAAVEAEKCVTVIQQLGINKVSSHFLLFIFENPYFFLNQISVQIVIQAY